MTELIRQYQNITNQDIKKQISEQIYTQYYNLFYKLCIQYKVLGEIEDLLQECFFALDKALNSYDIDNAEHNFTTHLCHNVCWHLLKYAKRNKSIFFDTAYKILSLNVDMPNTDEPTEYINTIVSDENLEEDAIKNYMQEWLSVEITKELKKLTDEEQQIIELKYKYKYSIEKIALEQCQTVDYIRYKISSIYNKMRQKKRVKEIHSYYLEELIPRAYKGGINSFKRTGESATEKVVFKMMRLEELIRKG